MLTAIGDRSFDFAQDDGVWKAAESIGMLRASAEYAPSSHFYPALLGDPSPRVYSRKASITSVF